MVYSASQFVVKQLPYAVSSASVHVELELPGHVLSLLLPPEAPDVPEAPEEAPPSPLVVPVLLPEHAASATRALVAVTTRLITMRVVP